MLTRGIQEHTSGLLDCVHPPSNTPHRSAPPLLSCRDQIHSCLVTQSRPSSCPSAFHMYLLPHIWFRFWAHLFILSPKDNLLFLSLSFFFYHYPFLPLCIYNSFTLKKNWSRGEMTQTLYAHMNKRKIIGQA
jgi:hypothetical protein